LIDISSIHIADQVLAQFTFAAASGVGAFVAVSFGLLMLMLDRFERLEQEARQATTAAANAVRKVLAKHADLPGNYVAPLDGYLPFIGLATSMVSVNSEKRIPGFVEWRSATSEIVQTSVAFSGKTAFHAEFSPAMDALDNAIQQMDWVRGTRPRTLRWTKAVVALASFLLVAVLGIGLAAVTESGVQDTWNLYGVAAVSVGLLALGFALVKAFVSMGEGRASWIAAKTRELEKARELEKPPSADGADTESAAAVSD
jgi:hypothetical protein